MKKLLSTKMFSTVFLTLVIILGVYTKSNAVPLSVFSGWNQLADDDGYTPVGHVDPGNGGQNFDAEYLFYKVDAGNLFLGLQTGFNVISGEEVWLTWSTYYSGDLALSFDGDVSTYEYAVDFGLLTKDYNDSTVGGNSGTAGVDTAGLYSGVNWSNAVNPIYEAATKPLAMISGNWVGGLTSNTAGYLPDENLPYNVGDKTFGGPSYYRIISFPTYLIAGLGDHPAFAAHWVQSCGNNPINGQVPEPVTMVLLGSLATGLFGFAGLKKRFTK